MVVCIYIYTVDMRKCTNMKRGQCANKFLASMRFWKIFSAANVEETSKEERRWFLPRLNRQGWFENRPGQIHCHRPAKLPPKPATPAALFSSRPHRLAPVKSGLAGFQTGVARFPCLVRTGLFLNRFLIYFDAENLENMFWICFLTR